MKTDNQKVTFYSKILGFCLENRLIVFLLVLFTIIWGIMVAPFDWDIKSIPRYPVAVDAIPDIGENQQIVFTEWMGRSPRDVEDQITYPLTSALLGIPGVRTVRSFSMFGFSSIYIIFEEDVEFYWSRSRVLEKLNSLPSGTLPPGVQPTLGPDATALGQVFWYTLEGRDEEGNPTGGWDLDELRTIQDYQVRYALMSAKGVSEVASVGGHVKEYQVDVDPGALRAFGIKLQEVVKAVQMSNRDVGARTIEVNSVEYVIRGIGFFTDIEDIENAVITVRDDIPVYIKNIATVTSGPALRRGALDKEGAEVVGGVAVVRYGENPLATIKNIKQKIAEISPGLPSRNLPDGTESKVTIVPFYDRTGLIEETLGTLNKALTEEILITIIVVILIIMNLRSSLLISGMLPLAVLMCFIAMKVFGVDANVVALSGIAIAIGTIVDMGIIMTENILQKLSEKSEEESVRDTIFNGAREVSGAITTAIATTIVSFLPVFTMQGAEGKLFKPLAFTKTFALFASVFIALLVIPPAAHLIFARRKKMRFSGIIYKSFIMISGILIAIYLKWWVGLIIIFFGIREIIRPFISERVNRILQYAFNLMLVFLVALLLAHHWLPLGPERGLIRNFLIVALVTGVILGFFKIFQMIYPSILRWSLDHKIIFLIFPMILLILGGVIWLGFGTIFGPVTPKKIQKTGIYSKLYHAFPGLGREFMPPLNEGAFLYMPTTMPHASIGEVMNVLQTQDRAIGNIPEVESVVGKLGRADTPLDPAPVSMIETIINYKPKYLTHEDGRRLTFRYDPESTDYFRNKKGEPLNAPDGKPYIVQGKFVRDDEGELIRDDHGKPFRLWRLALDPDINPGRDAWDGIENNRDIWERILEAAMVPGTTSAPFLQPISARIVMLQSGMRAPMGVKIKGPDLKSIEKAGLEIERFLKTVPSIDSSTVIADRIVGKPYIEIIIDRKAIARYGIMLESVQNVIETAIGGRTITTTVEGRERYPVRVRYLRELRDDIESLENIIVDSPTGSHIPLNQLADIKYVRGPQMIKSEDTFLVGYVLFDSLEGYTEVDVVEQAREQMDFAIEDGRLILPPGISFTFAGTYENQVRAQKRLSVILPLALFIIFMILYLEFRSTSTSLLVFSGILIAWAGGFVLIWLYGNNWFMNFEMFGVNMRELFQIHPINLSVAVWVGFLALFGIASDNGVVIATYLDQTNRETHFKSIKDIRDAALRAGVRRIRPCLMTTGTTALALLPVLTSRGRGSDIMIPMAIPTFGGILAVILSLILVPVLYSWIEEIKFRRNGVKLC